MRNQNQKNISISIDDLGGEIKLKSGVKFKMSLYDMRGVLWLKLLDETGSFPLAEISYSVRGPNNENFKSKTSNEGIVLHENVPICDFEIEVEGGYLIIAPSLLHPIEPHEQPVKGFAVQQNMSDEIDEEDEDTEGEGVDLINAPFEDGGDEIPDDLDANDLYDEE